MEKYKIISVEQSLLWDEIVTSFRNYDVHYLNAYNKAFQIENMNDSLLFYYDFKETRAMYVFTKRMITDIPYLANMQSYDTYSDIISPYGYGGFIIEGTDYSDVFNSFEVYCVKDKIVSNVSRLHLFYTKEQQEYWNVFSPQFNIVRDLEINEETLMLDFKYSFRKNLKTSFDSNLVIVIDENGDNLDKFIEIYNLTMKRNHAKEEFYFSRLFYQTLNQMKRNYAYFFVYKDNIAIATELVLYGPEYCYSFLGGTLEDFFNLHPNHFLKYEIMKWAKRKGLKSFVLGGGVGNDGIFNYKKSMAPNGVIPYMISYKIFNQKIYNELVNIRMKSFSQEISKNFFPEYRSI